MKKVWLRIVILVAAISVIGMKIEIKNQVQTASNTPKEDLEFRLFNTLPLSGKDILKIIKKRDPAVNEEKLTAGEYVYKFTDLAREVGLRQPGFIKISPDEIKADQIVSFHAFMEMINGNIYLSFNGKTKLENEPNWLVRNYYLVNVDNDFLRRHRVAVRRIAEFDDPVMKTNMFPQVTKYIQANVKKERIDFVNANKNYADLQKELINNFEVRIYKINDLAADKMTVAVFKPKKEQYPLVTDFSCILVNQQIERIGSFSEYTAFEIDETIYLGCFHQVVQGSGYWGKVLFGLKNNQLKMVGADYSFAD